MAKDVLFSEWLNELMQREQLTQANLARSSGLGAATISKLLSSKNKRPNPENCEKLAKALKLENTTVLRAAKWITGEPEYAEKDELNMVAAQLTDLKRQELLAMAWVMLEFIKKGSASVK